LSVSRLYNRQLGPIVSLAVHRPQLGDLPIYTSSCRHSPISALIRDLAARPSIGDGPLIPGGGKGATLAGAARGALGETAERLLAVLQYASVARDLRLATHAELTAEGCPALEPHRLPLFAPEQMSRGGAESGSWQPFTPNTPVRWISARFLRSGKPVLVPAQLVLLYYERVPGEAAIGYPTTGGLGFHADRRRAILHGLYEWIERDAINVGWATRRPPRPVDVDLRPYLPAPIPDRLQVRVFLNTLDVPLPVLTVIARDTGRDDLAFLGGGGASSGKDRALTQALFELGQCRAVLRSLGSVSTRRVQPTTPPGAMTDFLDATVFYGYRANERLLDWYTAGKPIAWEDVPSLEFDGLDDEWPAILDWLGVVGLDPVVCDFDAAAWTGAMSVKVIIPELTPAWVPADPYYGHPRYGLPPSKLNPLPLPFP
jgi:ribosomal protein S12 methylthiotransferase accessory factor